MKVQVSHRLDEELLSWATEYGESRGSSRAVVIEEALRHFQALSRGGVPDLPAEAPAPKSAPVVKPIPGLRRASSLEARNRANPSGLDRQARIEKARGA